MNAAAVATILSDVVDPELGIDIVALGLVYGIDIDAETIRVEMAMTSPDCPMADSIVRAAASRLAHAADGRELSFAVVDAPEWSIAMADQNALRRLGLVR